MHNIIVLIDSVLDSVRSFHVQSKFRLLRRQFRTPYNFSIACNCINTSGVSPVCGRRWITFVYIHMVSLGIERYQ